MDDEPGTGTGPGRPLDDVRVLALEQMQAVPFATQLMARLGADVVKVEPLTGDSARAARPAIVDEAGEQAGATFLRYNSGKRSIAIDLKTESGRELALRLAESCDVLAENLGPGRADRLGLSYEAVSARNPRIVYLSVSGFGKEPADSPYAGWPAYASVAEAMSGVYEHARRPHQPPVINPVGGLGDTGTGMFGVIGVLAALRQRERTGRGQHVDIAMLDAMISICDVPTNFWSMGLRTEPDTELRVPYLLKSFRSDDGWVVLQVSRQHQFERLARLLGREEWAADERFATGFGWYDHWDGELLPAIESWAGGLSMREAAAALASAGIAAAPCHHAEDVVKDPHVAGRHMLVEIPRVDSNPGGPVLVAGNPVKLSGAARRPESRPPLLGEHTVPLLTGLLGLAPEQVAELAEQGVVRASSPRGAGGRSGRED